MFMIHVSFLAKKKRKEKQENKEENLTWYQRNQFMTMIKNRKNPVNVIDVGNLVTIEVWN